MKKLVVLLCLPLLLVSGELKRSLIQAKKQDKPLMVMITSKECRYCTKMKNVTLSDTEVKKNLEGFLFAQVDKTDPETQRFLPAVTYVPTIFFVSPKWKIVGGADGYLPPLRFNDLVVQTRTQLGMGTESRDSEDTPKRDKWMYDLASAADYASQTNKEVLVFVYSSRSKYSKMLEKKTLSDPKVIKALKNFVWVKISYGDDSAKSYGIDPSGVPSVYFMNSDMEELAVATGYFEPNDFLAWVNYAKSKI